jgi:hypothetical protein
MKILVLALLLCVGFVTCSPRGERLMQVPGGWIIIQNQAHAGALDDRAPITIQVSPREAFALHVMLNQQQFKGDDQETEARISEVFGFAAIDVRARDIKRAEKREANGDDFSDKPTARMAPKDDLGRVVAWLKDASLPGAFNEILNPLVRRIRAAIAR